jgi:hypothetical protein
MAPWLQQTAHLSIRGPRGLRRPQSLHRDQVTRMQAHMADSPGAPIPAIDLWALPPALLERWLWRNAAEGLGL